MRRVVITGMGTVNPLGKNVEEFWANIKANKNGLSYVDQFDTENFPVKIVGAVKDFDCTEYIDKKEYKEFTVDMYYGKDNRVKAIVPRERIEIRAGEINKGRTRKNFLVDFLKERMNYLPGVIGCICIQLFYRETDNDVVGIEINPRFGGGYPLSYHAKADFAEYLAKEYFEGSDIDYTDDWLDNTLMLRYDSEVITYG